MNEYIVEWTDLIGQMVMLLSSIILVSVRIYVDKCNPLVRLRFYCTQQIL